MHDTTEAGPAPGHDMTSLMLGWVMVAVSAYLAWWGWLSLGWNELTPAVAVALGACQALTNWLAVAIRGLVRRRALPAALVAGVLMVFSGLTTHQSLIHAWDRALSLGYVSADMSIMKSLLVLFPFAEPLIFWIRAIFREVPEKPVAAPQPQPQYVPAPVAATRRRALGRGWLRVVESASAAALIAGVGVSTTHQPAFEKFISIAREQPSLTQDELAARSGVSRTAVQRWVRGINAMDEAA